MKKETPEVIDPELLELRQRLGELQAFVIEATGDPALGALNVNQNIVRALMTVLIDLELVSEKELVIELIKVHTEFVKATQVARASATIVDPYTGGPAGSA